MVKLRFMVQLALGAVFLLSSGGKLQDYRGFVQGLAAYRILPRSFAKPASFLIIGLECLLALAHLTGYLLGIGLRIALGLLGSFAVAVGINLKRGRAIPCHCFGQSGNTISGATLARLGLLGAGEAFLLKANQPLHPQQIAPPELCLASFWALSILAAGLWVFALEDIARLLRPTR